MKVLSFILQLGFCSLGTDYVCDNDDTEMSQVIQHFRELGLVFKRKGSSKENVIQILTKLIARFHQKSIFLSALRLAICDVSWWHLTVYLAINFF